VSEGSEGTGETNEAPEGTGETESLKNGEIRVQTSEGSIIYSADTADKFREAMKEALPGSTIELGAGTYSLYKSSDDMSQTEQAAWKELMKEKTFTFVGQSPEETSWRIGAAVYPNKPGEYNSDYSFEGSKSITFQNMKLFVPYEQDYLGFSHTNDTLVENCVIEGRTQYWGYNSATFRHTKFVCAEGGWAYALWTYSSATETFDHCTFDASVNPDMGKIIYVHHDGADKTFTINFNDCTVISKGAVKQVLYIKDVTKDGKPENFIINISGKNIINGDVPVDSITCSRLFGFGGNKDNNKGNTIVNFGNTTVWQGGKMLDAKAYHNSGVTADGVAYNNNVDGSNDSLYAEGYKDHALVTTHGEWIANEDGTTTRDVTKKCTYCGYEENGKEYQVKLTYDANGGEGAIDSATGAAGESVTVAENVFTRNNYTFTGWNTQADGKGTAYKPGDSFTLTDKDTVLYAQWSKNAPAQVNVSYDANGGTGTMESITGDVGSEIVIGQNGFARSGYTFTGWNTQADGKGTAYKPGDSFTLTDKDTVLYAQWNKLVTVSFDLCGHGGANIPSQTFVSGNKASEPTAPKEDGWVFGGWYTEKGCQYRFSFDSAVTSDITLYAKWDRVTTVVSAPVATPTPSPAPAAAATKTVTVKNAAIPQTSDAFPMEGMLALLAVGAVGFGAAGWLRKKHH
jgi:uncharacterized repeat protein (TIGR02543 family)